MTTRIGFKVDADVDAALGNFEKFADAGEDAGKDAAKGVDGLASATDRARKSMDDLHAAQRRVGSYKLTAAIADMRAYEAAIKAAVAAGAGLPGWGAGALAGGGHAPAGGLGGGGGQPYTFPAPYRTTINGVEYEVRNGRHYPVGGGGAAGGGLGIGGMLGGARGYLGAFGVAYTGYQFASAGMSAATSAADLQGRQDAIWRTGNARIVGAGEFESFKRMLDRGGEKYQTTPEEFTEYYRAYSEASHGPRSSDDQGDAARVGVGFSVGMGVDRGIGVSAMAQSAFWGKNKQDAAYFAAQLAQGIVRAGATQQAGGVLGSLTGWMHQTGSIGAEPNVPAWFRWFEGLSKQDNPVGHGVSGANMLSGLGAAVTGSQTNPAAMSFWARQLDKQGINKDVYGLMGMLDQGPFADIGNGKTLLDIGLAGLDAEMPEANDDKKAVAAKSLFGGNIPINKALLEAGRKLKTMGGTGRNDFMEYLDSRKGRAGFRDDAYGDLAKLFGENSGLGKDEKYKLADDMAFKIGREETAGSKDLQQKADTETSKIIDMGQAASGATRQLDSLAEGAWKAGGMLIDALRGKTKDEHGFSKWLMDKQHGEGAYDKWLKQQQEKRDAEGGDPLHKMSFDNAQLQRQMLQDNAIQGMMMASLAAGKGANIGGFVHTTLRGGRFGGIGMPAVGGLGGSGGGTMEDQKEIHNYLLANGVSPIHAAGIMANIQGESGFNKSAINPKSGAYGLFQYLGSRKSGLFAAYGDSPTARQQIDYALSENDTKKYLSRDFGSSADAAEWWTRNWERPGDPDSDAAKRRQIAPRFEQPLPPTPPPAQGGAVTLSGDGTITLNFQDTRGNPIPTDPPKTIVKLRTQSYALNAQSMVG